MLVGRQIPECLVWSGRSVRRLSCLQRLVESGQIQIPTIALPELPTTTAIETLHLVIERWAPRWRRIQRNPALLTGQLEPGHELGPTIE